MFKESYHVLGIMSGTSLDGLDVAELFFEWNNHRWEFRFGATRTFSFPGNLIEKLRNCVTFQEDECTTLDHEFSAFTAQCIQQFLSDFKIVDLDAICMHGHTVKHEPHNRFTLQIGFQKSYYASLQVPLVVDFRTQDVQMGGQGAPLVPIGDALLFADYDYCLNLGGFSNISFQYNNQRWAFDICPVNTVLNHYVQPLQFAFDRDGVLARSGQVDASLLSALNALPFYSLAAPKSLGVEFVRAEVLPLIDSFSLSIPDILATFVEHIAIQMRENLKQSSGKILVTGGGAYHVYLMERLRFHAPHLTWVVPEDALVSFKEALIFGFLGIKKLRNETNILASVTGAPKDHVGGRII